MRTWLTAHFWMDEVPSIYSLNFKPASSLVGHVAVSPQGLLIHFFLFCFVFSDGSQCSDSASESWWPLDQ